MTKYICVNKCFYRGRVWAPGETLAPASASVVPPKHFKVKAAEDKKPAPEQPAKPMSLHGMQKAEAEAEQKAAREKAEAIKAKLAREAEDFLN